MNLQVEGTITEEGTGVALTSTASVAVTTTLSTITFERVDTYYKPGIPLFGEVKLVDGANVPMANETIEIRVFKLRTSYTTDDQGRAQFSVYIVKSTDESITIQAHYKSEAQCSDEHWISPDHESASRSVRRFYSPSQSYLHIESISGTLSCGHVQPVRVHYVLNRDVMKEEKVVFHYLNPGNCCLPLTELQFLAPLTHDTFQHSLEEAFK
ncbi:alpha-1-macroglobulin-like [Rhineura floridana]|uniref:alpha-1-macroglobulin-like n=1 Tax=Rhineura floridana TaxID=261503 RepID=UPI002AC82400|nr:alpha-1-macroglobulin-like [Rhineura floridana]XP_061477225.1 alpha-1-macroglobulin-like [Rhineura floridana]XP_061477226.1 alpha-1-macroglobulin-like [Rhineura floridana]XP_061477227.1 alpha-1-macroglobulin-like [Rhineura floridana]